MFVALLFFNSTKLSRITVAITVLFAGRLKFGRAKKNTEEDYSIKQSRRKNPPYPPAGGGGLAYVRGLMLRYI